MLSMPTSSFRSTPSAGFPTMAMPSTLILMKLGGVCFSSAAKSKSSTDIRLIWIGSAFDPGVLSGGGVTTTSSSTKPLSPSPLALL